MTIILANEGVRVWAEDNSKCPRCGSGNVDNAGDVSLEHQETMLYCYDCQYAWVIPMPVIEEN